MGLRVSLILILCLLGLGAALAYFLLPTSSAGLVFQPVPYTTLVGWDDDDLKGFDRAFAKSCEAIGRMPDDRALPGGSIGGLARDWKIGCRNVSGLSGAALRAAIEKHFQPFSVSVNGKKDGHFTGYYEPLLQGSRVKSDQYSVPLYTRPGDLVEVNLGDFRPDLTGRRVAGRVENGRLKPYASRASIDGGALDGSVAPLLWVSDPVAAFFLHIQGSGRVALPDGDIVAVGYAGQNGHPYVAVGRLLIREGHATREEMSLQFIRQWLADNPAEADRVMHANPSFIFFRDLGEVDGPYGSSGVVLTPGRSIAVDRRHLPMHAPLFVMTTQPDPDNPDGPNQKVNRLMVAQDTGGAITGEVRGDLFYGPGDRAEKIAGHMNASGRYFLLLPRHGFGPANQDSAR